MGWVLVGVAAVGTAVAAWSTSEPPALPDAVVPSVAPRDRVPVQATIVGPQGEDAATRRTPGLAAADPFVVWTPPPAALPRKVAPPPPPPAPVAPAMPPFPYRVFGKFQAPDGKRIIYLVRDNRIVAIEKDMDLGDGFMVESVGESSIRIVHQPLGEHLTLPVPEASR